MRAGTLALVLVSSCAAVPAWAGVPQSELIASGMPENLAPFAARISLAEGGWESDNQFGCVGFFQACGATFTSLYGGTKEQFKADRPGQVQVYLTYARTSWSQVRPYLGQLRGQQVSYGGKSFVIDDSAILFGMQFGLGRIQAFIRGGCEAPKAGRGTSPAIDGNGVSVCTYFGKGVGYDVSAITGIAYANLQPVQPGVPDTAEPGVPPLVEGSPQSSDTWNSEAEVLADRKRIAIERAIMANKDLQIEAQRMDAERRLGLLWAMRVLADVDRLERRRADNGTSQPGAGASLE
ncbi:hypothetical protein FFK22_016795 [Mycobacterium sp. KBS0706]|uniref:hypothetical protein n=1 Tax=Mycobacterium sp. KBS0706 TaxID=2578109 RepID=UPI00110FCEFD|nr:hypothetical protein [Mycobacterium sp. KBS0706]TSD87501.1 hypothetical protein FFK22_016795 [Mycobacterium sp. KBS0706]